MCVCVCYVFVVGQAPYPQQGGAYPQQGGQPYPGQAPYPAQGTVILRNDKISTISLSDFKHDHE